jgi:hypothetical protein
MPQCQFPVFCYFGVSEKLHSKFLELDETKAKHPEIYRIFQRTEEETERGHRPATQQGSVAQTLVATPMCEAASVHF